MQAGTLQTPPWRDDRQVSGLAARSTACLAALSAACFYKRASHALYAIPLRSRLSVPSPWRGVFVLRPPKLSSKLPNWNMKHYKSVEFFQIWTSSPLQKRKVSLNKRKADLLTTCWRRFCRLCNVWAMDGRRMAWPISSVSHTIYNHSDALVIGDHDVTVAWLAILCSRLAVIVTRWCRWRSLMLW